MNILKAKRSIRSSAIVIVLAATTMINITRYSHIRAVEFLSILACGMAIGAFIFSLARFINMKREASQKV